MATLPSVQASAGSSAPFLPEPVKKKRARSESSVEFEQPKKKPRTDAEYKAEVPEAFEQFYRDRSIRVLSWPDPQLLKNLEELIGKNLSLVASLKFEQKLSFSPSGEITSRSAWGLSWGNWYGSKVNRINNLRAFGDFVEAYYKNKTKDRVPGAQDVVPRSKLLEAAKGLDQLRQTYMAEFGKERHEEITEGCIRTFIRLATKEVDTDSFIRSMYASFIEVKEGLSDRPNSYLNAILRFSHLIDPFIQHLKTSSDPNLNQVVEFLKSCHEDGYFQEKYFTLLFACFFINLLAPKQEISETTVPFLQLKIGLNQFCFRLCQAGAAKAQGQKDDASLEKDKQLLEQTGQTLFLEVIKQKAINIQIKTAEKEKYSYYGDILIIAGAIGTIGLSSTVSIPSVLVALATKEGVGAVKDLLERAEKQLDSKEHEKLSKALKSVKQLIEENNGNLDEIVHHLEKEYKQMQERGEEIKKLLEWFKEAKNEETA